MTPVERLRAAQAKKGLKPGSLAAEAVIAAAMPEPAPEPPAAPAPKKKVKPDKGPLPTAYQCGHPFLPHEVAKKQCPACRDRARGAKQRAKRLAKLAKLQASGKNPYEPGATRLPGWSRITTVYDPDKVQWSGELVMTVDGEAVTFSAINSGVFNCLRMLDMQYRHWLEAREAKANQRPASSGSDSPADPSPSPSPLP